jgi:hypothetical protein
MKEFRSYLLDGVSLGTIAFLMAFVLAACNPAAVCAIAEDGAIIASSTLQGGAAVTAAKLSNPAVQIAACDAAHAVGASLPTKK